MEMSRAIRSGFNYDRGLLLRLTGVAADCVAVVWRRDRVVSQ